MARQPTTRTHYLSPLAADRCKHLLARDLGVHTLSIECMVRGWNPARWEELCGGFGLDAIYRYAQGLRVKASFKAELTQFFRGHSDSLIAALGQRADELRSVANSVSEATGRRIELRLEVAPASGLSPCRFCGEVEHLQATTAPRPIVRDGVVLEDDVEEVAAIWCPVCEAVAPLDVWNGTRNPTDYAALRDFDPPAERVGR